MKFLELLTTHDLAPECVASARSVLREEARAFLSSGGTVTLSEWDAMSELARRVFVEASAEVRRARAEAHALAIVTATVAALREAGEIAAVNAGADAAVRAVSGGRP